MRLVKWLVIYLTLGLAVAGLVLAAVLWVTGLRSLPDDNDSVRLPNLSAPVTILFDDKGIPTIRANTMRDAYRSLGYLHARDRLWQMESMRRIGAGRMAEIIGKPMITYDILMRELGLYRQAEAQLVLMDQSEKDDLQAYADGVNAFLTQHDRPFPIEFQLTQFQPEPWTVADSLVWGRLMSLQLSGDAFREAQTAALIGLLGRDKAAQLMPRHTKSLATMNDGNRDGWLSQYDASNAWVLSGARTESGKPILANDPHLGLNMPGQWYLARIETPELTLVGATAPGVPMHILGHNGKIAWGMTTTHADTQDTITLDQRSLDSATTRTEIIQVRFGDPVHIVVRETDFGPAITRLGSTPRALIWTGHSDRQRAATALYQLNRAQNWQDFLNALSRFDDPAQNVFYADTKGHIGMKVVGSLPIRAPGQNGTVPLSLFDDPWHGVVPPSELPGLYNPVSGLIFNANNRIITDAYPYLITDRFPADYRAMRLKERLAETPKNHRLEDSMSIQNDIVSTAAQRLVPLFVKAEPNTEQAAEALQLLRDWDFSMDRKKAAPAVYMTLLNETVRVLAEDDLGPDAFKAFWRADADFVELALSQAPTWCDDIRTTPVESCKWALSTALDRAVFGLSQKQGNSPSDWRWGKMHTATMKHQLLSLIPGLALLGNRPIETSGGDHTINRGQSRGGEDDQPFAHIHGAGYRAIYDLNNLNNSLFALAGGQSGNPFSPHYSDLMKDWRDGRYFRIPGRAEDIPEHGGALLKLTP
ncbi:MAG: penicillin acylase family protein [Alphaproteobacteria bacterium]|nr:penicillin acylase family protein [Alphaproteobacteria bacterium]